MMMKMVGVRKEIFWKSWKIGMWGTRPFRWWVHANYTLFHVGRTTFELRDSMYVMRPSIVQCASMYMLCKLHPYVLSTRVIWIKNMTK